MKVIRRRQDEKLTAFQFRGTEESLNKLRKQNPWMKLDHDDIYRDFWIEGTPSETYYVDKGSWIVVNGEAIHDILADDDFQEMYEVLCNDNG